jgi:hypothetical protein
MGNEQWNEFLQALKPDEVFYLAYGPYFGDDFDEVQKKEITTTIAKRAIVLPSIGQEFEDYVSLMEGLVSKIVDDPNSYELRKLNLKNRAENVATIDLTNYVLNEIMQIQAIHNATMGVLSYEKRMELLSNQHPWASLKNICDEDSYIYCCPRESMLDSYKDQKPTFSLNELKNLLPRSGLEEALLDKIWDEGGEVMEKIYPYISYGGGGEINPLVALVYSRGLTMPQKLLEAGFSRWKKLEVPEKTLTPEDKRFFSVRDYTLAEMRQGTKGFGHRVANLAIPAELLID